MSPALTLKVIYIVGRRTPKTWRIHVELSSPLHWCWNTGITGMVQENKVYKKHKHYTGLIVIAVSMIFTLKTKHLRKTPQAIQMALFGVRRYIITYQTSTPYLYLPAVTISTVVKWKAAHQTKCLLHQLCSPCKWEEIKPAAYCHL